MNVITCTNSAHFWVEVTQAITPQSKHTHTQRTCFADVTETKFQASSAPSSPVRSKPEPEHLENEAVAS